MTSLLWERVGELADRAPRISDLRHHKLHLIAASRMRARGETVPVTLLEEERYAAAVSLTVPMLLRRVRAECDGPIVLMKGAEVALRWPQARLRPSVDIDLLVEDPDAVQSALLAGGFVEIDKDGLLAAAVDFGWDAAEVYGELHHHCPLGYPGIPLAIEVHRQPHWCNDAPPSTEEIVAAAQPCALGVEGILAPRPDHHAVLLAAHAWAHGPLDRISLLADVAVMLEETTPDATAAVAEGWGVRSTWRATTRAIEELLVRESEAEHAPVWRRHLVRARERTVFEEHVARIVAPMAVAPNGRAPVALLAALAKAARPYPQESWGAKLSRSARAFRHAAWSRSQHEALEPRERNAA